MFQSPPTSIYLPIYLPLFSHIFYVPNHQPDYVYSHIYFPQSGLWAHNGRIHTLWSSNMARKDPFLTLPICHQQRSLPCEMAHRNRWFTMVYLLKMVIFHCQSARGPLQKMDHFFLVGGFVDIPSQIAKD